MKLLEVVDMADLNAASLWQCCIKLQAKAGGASDAVRLLAFEQLLQAFRRLIVTDAPSQDLQRWSQFLKAALKLNKQVFRRHSLSKKTASLIMEILTGKGLADDLVIALLELPARGMILPKVSQDDLLSRLQNFRLGAGTIGNLLVRANGAQNRFSELFSPCSDRSKTALLLWGEGEAKISRPLNLLCLMDFALTSKLRLHAGQASRLADLLAIALFNARNHSEASFLPSLLRAMLCKCLAGHSREWTRLSLLTRMIFAAHVAGPKLKGRHNGVLSEAGTILSRLISNASHDMVCYWPLAAWTNICRELPQPTTCQELRMACFRLASCQSRQLRELMGESWKVSLRFCGAVDFVQLQAILKGLSVERALQLVACLSFLDSIRQDGRALGGIMESILLRSPEGGVKLSSYHLKYIEMFLRHAADVSIFESAALEQLQPHIVAFLKREAHPPTQTHAQTPIDSQIDAGDIEKFLLTATVKIPDGLLQLPASTRSDLGGDISKMIDQLEHFLNLGPSLVQADVVARLQQLINKFT